MGPTINPQKLPIREVILAMCKVKAAPSKTASHAKMKGFLKYLNIEENLPNLYPVLRLFLPVLDRHRGSYKMKEKAIAKIFAESMMLNATDRNILEHWNSPHKLRLEDSPYFYSSAVDLPSLIRYFSSVRMSKTDTSICAVNVEQMNDKLDTLVQCGSHDKRVAWASSLIYGSKDHPNFTPDVIGWTIRLILKDLKLGLSDETILKIIHPGVAEAYLTSFNLKDSLQFDVKKGGVLVMEGLSQTQGGDMGHQYPPKSTVQPMLASVTNSVQLESILKSDSYQENPLYIEPKWDGERCLINVSRNENGDIQINTFSRNGYDTTHIYGKHLYKSLLNELECVAATFDSEVLSWNSRKGRPQPFAYVKPTAKGSLVGNKDIELSFCIFDILNFHNGEIDLDLCPFSYLQRREFLDRVLSSVTKMEMDKSTCQVIQSGADPESRITDDDLAEMDKLREEQNSSDDVPTVVKISPYLLVPPDMEYLLNVLKLSALRKEEGLMLKYAAGRYKYGSRSGADGWLKFKPSHGTLGDSLDVAVVGCYISNRGESRRDIESEDPLDHITSVLLAVACPGQDGNMFYFSLSKVGSGLSIVTIKEIRNRLRGNVVAVGDTVFEWLDPFGLNLHNYAKRESERKIDDLDFQSLMQQDVRWSFKLGAGERPDYVIKDPRNAFLISVQAAEAIKSNKFGCGITLRFPRVDRVRFDKGAAECLNIQKLKEIYERSRCDDEVPIEAAPADNKPKRRKLNLEAISAIEDDVETSPMKTNFNLNIFAGITFCILNCLQKSISFDLPKKYDSAKDEIRDYLSRPMSYLHVMELFKQDNISEACMNFLKDFSHSQTALSALITDNGGEVIANAEAAFSNDGDVKSTGPPIILFGEFNKKVQTTCDNYNMCGLWIVDLLEEVHAIINNERTGWNQYDQPGLTSQSLIYYLSQGNRFGGMFYTVPSESVWYGILQNAAKYDFTTKSEPCHLETLKFIIFQENVAQEDIEEYLTSSKIMNLEDLDIVNEKPKYLGLAREKLCAIILSGDMTD